MASKKTVWGGDIMKPLLLRMSLWQLGLLLPIAVIIAAHDRLLALSILLGGLSFSLPHCWFAWYVFRPRGEEHDAEQTSRRLYRGEAQKLVLTGVLCGVTFTLVQPLNAAGFFSAFFAMMILGWVTSARLAHGTDQV
ncbi:F0F1 ATP synthase subunit I [Alcanivorax hongdengensis A-11-3]|uniref:F0F1 ATP synthase subunit I n=1 Tax=Alcanivorax hongdengensis A-11-3 TaxID=1177179 RepID=L0WBY3_9GAMM|nr:ATP synthase subunit I [Alcanivorax hongdengensis]EKF73250.1 F0F1 ATP synthase subunit I [Alcanivorax hongdengensis A-11-3]